MKLPGLPCASWRDPKQPRQVELWHCGWTNDEFAAVMDRWRWSGSEADLVTGLKHRTRKDLVVEKLAPVNRGGDLIYVVKPRGTETRAVIGRNAIVIERFVAVAPDSRPEELVGRAASSRALAALDAARSAHASAQHAVDDARAPVRCLGEERPR